MTVIARYELHRETRYRFGFRIRRRNDGRLIRYQEPKTLRSICSVQYFSFAVMHHGELTFYSRYAFKKIFLC